MIAARSRWLREPTTQSFTKQRRRPFGGLEFYGRCCWVNILDKGGGIEEGEQGGDFVAVSFFSLGGNHLVKGAEVDRVLLNPPYVSKVIT